MALYIVATPIGNLEDISLRALRILKESDYILCEDTRVSKKLLDHYQIKTKLISFHHHSPDSKYQEILSLLKKGMNLALVSDAGTPGISDPGGLLINFIRQNDPEILIEAIPGASALSSALSVSGIKIDKFLFLGFLPHKKGRAKLIEEIISCKYPVVLFESKHRILKLLKEIEALKSNKEIMIFRELTKIYSSFYQGRAGELLNKLEVDNNSLKGEFVLIIY